MKLSVWYETADSFYFLSYRDEEIRTLTEALARVLKTEEGRNQARQLIHAHENDDVDSKLALDWKSVATQKKIFTKLNSKDASSAA